MSPPRLRGLYGAQIPGQLTLKPRMVDRRPRHQRRRGALAAAAASLLKAIRLPVLAAAQPHAWQQAQHRWLILQSALALAVFAAAGGLLWFGDSLVSGFAVLAALLLGAALGLPAILELVLVARPAQRAPRARGLVLGRQPPAAFGIVAGADGAAARARGQCRCRHHGRNLQPDFRRSGSTDGWRRTSTSTHPTMRRPPRSRRGCASVPKSRRSCRAAAPRRKSAGAPIEILGLARSRHLPRPLAAAASQPTMPGSGFALAMPASSANNWPGV